MEKESCGPQFEQGNLNKRLLKLKNLRVSKLRARQIKISVENLKHRPWERR